MKMKHLVKETRIWKKDYLELDVKIAEQRKAYCKKQTKLGRKDAFRIYEESRRKFK